MIKFKVNDFNSNGSPKKQQQQESSRRIIKYLPFRDKEVSRVKFDVYGNNRNKKVQMVKRDKETHKTSEKVQLLNGR